MASSNWIRSLQMLLLGAMLGALLRFFVGTLNCRRAAK